MAEAYGSLARPVQLDPFQNIVNVHWNTMTHIAFKVHVKSSVSVVNPGVEWAGEFYELITGLEDDTDYLGTSELVYGNEPVNTFQGWNGHAWGPIADPTIDGLPSLSGSAASYGAWSYTAFKDIADPPTVADVPRAKWDDASGAGTGLFIPDIDSTEFKTGAAGIHLEASAFTGDPHFEGTVTPWPGPPNEVFWAAPFNHGATTPIAPLAFDISNIVAVVDGKAFRAMASAPVTTMEPEPSILVAGSVLWVLCERSPADDPTP
ncbi:hypothetical protein [Mesorhizobium sp.]|uniref:hypothetical protein n=1 Tax=Mesorhizobium sp. TaxID=1871066 RepID=UPI00120E5E7A|nr:hypothetical protein [Mesorhizobium sp.]TIM09127.1 MAG: hypothetical protein E5Y62_13295 [Mesorhizobium sp.]